MEQTYLQFYWSFIYQIIAYAVDEQEDKPLTLDGKTVEIINQKIFLDELYVPWEDELFEEHLILRMTQASPLIFIPGGRGCGKTSAIRYAIRKIEKALPQHKIVLFDANPIAHQGVFDPKDPSEARENIRESIRLTVQQETFGQDRCSLLAWLLAGQPDDSASFQQHVITDLLEFSSEAETVAHLSGARTQRYDDLRKYFEHDNAFMGEMSSKIKPHLRAAHVILAATFVKNWQRIILIYDNIDRIPSENQRTFRQVVEDTHSAVSPVCTSVLAIREENVRGEIHPPGEGGSHMILITPTNERYPAFIMPRVQPKHAEAVLAKRFAYGNSLFDKHAKGTIDVDESQMSIKSIHAGVVGELIDSSFHGLTNGNMTAMAGIYTEFMQYLLAVDKRTPLKFTKLDSPSHDRLIGHLHTLFFLWLRQKGNQYHIHFHDVLKVDKPDEADDFASMGSEHHFLMTCILNLTKDQQQRPHPEDYPTFHQVYERLSELGFQLNQIRHALVDMCATEGEPARMIEFYQSTCAIQELSEDSPDRMQLTDMGNVLITKIYSKVGYAWGLAADPLMHRESGDTEGKDYFDLSPVDRIRLFIRYMIGKSKIHLKLLSLVRDMWRDEHGEQWLGRYKERFGVNCSLQIDRILNSALRFYGDRWARAILELSKSYNALRDELYCGKRYDELDLRILNEAQKWIMVRS